MQRQEYLVEQFNKIENADYSKTKETLESFISQEIRNYQGGHSQGDMFLSSIEACLIAGEKGLRNEYKETFNRTLNSKLGLKKKNGFYLEAEVLSKEEQVVAEQFAQSVQTATGGVILGGQLRTNVSNLIDKYFYNNSILADVTVMPYGEDTETITDYTNERIALASDEMNGDAFEDNTTISDTITPSIRISDIQEISLKLKEVMNPVNSATQLAKMLRAVKNQIETMIIGNLATGTNGTNQFFSIMNSQTAIGSNRGSIAVVLPIALGVRPANHIDAINVAAGELPIFSAEDASQFKVCTNWRTAIKLMRVMDTTNQYYYDYDTKTFKSLLTGGEIRIVNSTSLADDLIGIWDLKSVIVKMSRGFEIQTRIASLQTNKMEICIDTYADATISMAYKAIPLKNGFRHITLKADYAL